MKTLKKIFVFWIFLTGCNRAAMAEENYWLKIRKYDEQRKKLGNIEAREKISFEQNEYINSLDSNQLLISGRQFWEFCEINRPSSSEKVFNDGPSELIFIARQYPKKGGLTELEPLFREIEDTNQNVFWRATLLLFMREKCWLEVLDSKQIYSAIDRLLAIVSDKNTHYRLRYEVSETTRELLEQLEKNNLLAEPVIRKKLQSGEQLKELRKEVIDGKIILPDDYKQAQVRTMRCYDNYVQVLLPILNESKLDAILQKGILKGLKTSLGKQIESVVQTRNTLENAVRNYKRFDKENWGYIIQIGHEKLQLPDSIQINKNMIIDLKNMLEVEKDKKSKIQIQSEIDSLKRVQKKFENEKQAHPDPNNLNSVTDDANLRHP